MNNYNSSKGQYKSYVDKNVNSNSNNSIYDMAITCNRDRCREPLLIEYDPTTDESIAYELTDLSQEQKQIVHKHQCNEQLRNSVVNAVAVEKWCLYEQNRTFKN